MNLNNILDRAREFVSYDTDETRLVQRDVEAAAQQFLADAGFVEVSETIPVIANQSTYMVNSVVLPFKVTLDGQEIPRTYEDVEGYQAYRFEFPRLTLTQVPIQSATLVVAGYGAPTSLANAGLPSAFEKLAEDCIAALAAGKFLLRFRDNARAQMFLAEYHNSLRRLKPRSTFVRKPKPVQGSVDVI
ncbi:MAG: hypothetical protein WHX60_08580 [Armatimonadota bacterium]